MRRKILRNGVRLKGLAQSGHWPSGNPRFYYRRKGEKAVPMPDLPKDDPRFIKAWAAAEDAKPILPRRQPRKGTIAAGLLAYRASGEFAKLAPGTREYRNRILSKIEADYGTALMRDLEARHIRADLRKHAPHAANHRLKVWRALCSFWTSAVDQQRLRQIARAYIQKGEEIATNAAYCGEMSDRGGGTMVKEGKAFIAGLDGRLPENWRDFVADIDREEERERAEYERLKAKFGNT